MPTNTKAKTTKPRRSNRVQLAVTAAAKAASKTNRDGNHRKSPTERK